MSSNIYTAGLQNAGSYRVSGQPFIKRQTINAGEEVKIEFPYVTKNVIVKIPNPPNLAYQGNKNESRLQTSPAGVSHPGEYDLGGSGKDFTVSFWYKQFDLLTWKAGNRVVQFTSGGGASNTYEMKGGGANVGKYRATTVSPGAATGLSFPAAGSGSLDWYRVTLTQITGTFVAYHNAASFGSIGSDANNFDDIQLPANSGTAMTSSFDEMVVFNSGMTNAQVTELYNSGEYYNPTRHSLSANLLSWHTMGDDPSDGIDTGQSIKDLSGTNEELNLFSTGDNDFVAGPWTTQTTGKVRIHSLSLTSSSGANIVPHSHFKELQGYGQSYSMPMKSKEIYISAVDAQVTVEIIAELTNIPTGRMYELEGSGIDE